MIERATEAEINELNHAERKSIISAAQSPFILACKTREDVELAANAKLSDGVWERMVAKAAAQGCSVGELLHKSREVVQKNAMKRRLLDSLEVMFKNPDGSNKSQEELEGYLNAKDVIQSAEELRAAKSKALAHLDLAQKTRRKSSV